MEALHENLKDYKKTTSKRRYSKGLSGVDGIYEGVENLFEKEIS